MADDESTDSTTFPIDLEVKKELLETYTSSPSASSAGACSPSASPPGVCSLSASPPGTISPGTSTLDANSSDFVPLHTTPRPKIRENNNTMPNEKNGNGLEKNGQKRIQTAPIDANDGTNKKPRINTQGQSTIKIENICAEETNSNEETQGNATELNQAAGDATNRNQTGEMEQILMDQPNESEEYYLTVHNLPTDWTYMQIKNFLDQQCGHVDEMEMLKHKKSKNCCIRLTFQSIVKCIDVFKKLENKYVHNKKLKVKITDTYTTFPTGVTFPTSIADSIKQFTITNETIAATRWRPDLDSFDTDPEGLYGLRPEFLKALGITPPLNNMVHVTNFRCDKNELKEVMEMAGNVLMCCVVAIVTKYAKVMYSHPLEAVQAISMLNGQLYYGSPLKITMDKNPADSVVLPKGLAGIGQGLGIKARPIRNIVQQYHRYANKQTSSINPIIFSEIDFTEEYANKIKTEKNPEEIEEKISEFVKSRPGCNILNPTVPVKVENVDESQSSDSMDATDSTAGAATAKNGRGSKNNSVASPQDQAKKVAEKQQSNSPRLATPAFAATAPYPHVRPGNPSHPGFLPPNMVMNPPIRNPGPMTGPREPFFVAGNAQDPRTFRQQVPYMRPSIQRPPFAQPRPPFGSPAVMRSQVPPANFNGPRANVGNSVTVKFSNLPPSTTFPSFCDLLAQYGQVMSVQLTTPGCAVATFGHPSHAQRCFQTFNGMNVEGFIVAVTFA